MPAGKRGRPSAATAGPQDESAAGPGPGSTASGIVALHRSRMFDWKPSAVVAIAPCPGAPLFAVGYECGRLELWDMLQLVCTQTVIGPPLELTSLAWALDTVSNTWRTFAAFLDGTLAEVVWRQGAVAHSQDSYGGVVWSLVASPASVVKPGFAHVLAAACDDGSVRLFGCEGGEPGLVLERVLARLEGRLLCATWHAGGTALAVAGSKGNIHVLDAVTGHERVRITAAAATMRPVTVWRLLSLPDGTLVSGDSDGAVQMWDSRFGTLLHRFTQHKADVLALAATEDGSCVFAAGVDSQVAQFARVTGGGGGGVFSRAETWTYTHYKRPHTHDVRALGVLPLGADRGAVLLSGGVDAQLIAYPAQAFLHEHPSRLSKCPQRPICQATVGAPAAPSRLLVAQQDTLDVWQLASASSAAAAAGAAVRHHEQGPEGEPLELLTAPRHLARIKVKGARVAAAAMSPSGAFVACSTPLGTRAYRLESAAAASAAAPAVTRLKLASAAASEAAVAVAATDSHLVLALHNGSLLSCELPSGAVAARAPVRPVSPAEADWSADAQAWRNHCPPAASLVASADGSLLAAVGCHGISLHRLPGLEPHGRLLRADGAFTAVAFSHDGRLIAATTSACQLLLWDTVDCRQVQWCLDNAEAATAAIARLPGAPTAISFNPAAAGASAAAAAAPAAAYRVVVNSNGGMVHFDLSRPVAETYLTGKEARRQRRRPVPVEDRPESRGSNGRVIRTAHPAVWVGHVGPAELLLLEKPWEKVLAELPPPLYLHRYGN
ncbi:hypothetical protein Agub_g3833 [Astrephomene gubernaculifera]|uniref:Uncharacterized protein n=1 Tax=Astrephomene gubernaculifera TaxID=47775 RepID=A0AAD3HJS5_9CHLO|nr:hypothetical protein Agub_g3833 [Astrephomene gubernaculifera]